MDQIILKDFSIETKINKSFFVYNGNLLLKLNYANNKTLKIFGDFEPLK